MEAHLALQCQSAGSFSSTLKVLFRFGGYAGSVDRGPSCVTFNFGLDVPFGFCSYKWISAKLLVCKLHAPRRLHGYRGILIRKSRFNKSAAKTVETLYRRGQGKSYRIVARSRSPMLQTRVLNRLLQEEAEMSHGEARKRASVNSESYIVQLAGEENRVARKCYVLKLTPRAKSPHLLKGQAWINQEDVSLVRIEGKQSASPSFLAGRPPIVRDYERVGDFWLAKSSHAVSENFFFGTTELSITYVDYHLLSEEPRAIDEYRRSLS